MPRPSERAEARRKENIGSEEGMGKGWRFWDWNGRDWVMGKVWVNGEMDWGWEWRGFGR
jgi:hypothetical protein